MSEKEVLAELKLADLMSQDDYDLITQALSQAEADVRAFKESALDAQARLTQADARSERYEKALELATAYAATTGHAYRCKRGPCDCGLAEFVNARTALTEQETPK